MEPHQEKLICGFEAAVEKFRPVLVTIAEAMISPAHRGDIEASDLVQQTLLDLEGSFARLEQVLAEDATSPSEVVSRNEQIANLLSALQELPEKQRMDVIMKHLQGLSLKEIALSLDLSESATAGLLHRGRQSLIHRMGNGDK